MTGHPLADALPGEEELARYNHGELTLTTHRVAYHGQGRKRHEASYLRVAHLTGTALLPRTILHPRLVLVPIGIFSLGFLGAFAIEDGGPFVLGSLGALVTSPLPFIIRGRILRLATAGNRLDVSVPRAKIAEAQGFLRDVEAARHAAEADAASPPAPTSGPVARPYRG